MAQGPTLVWSRARTGSSRLPPRPLTSCGRLCKVGKWLVLKRESSACLSVTWSCFAVAVPAASQEV